ncbi:MAG TPA: acylneuraminate cytidylyltransferase family protein [Anaerolineae bacterium]|nr:acylneuraminate cytidylyltransferase family protein [Anaerolineae bacterium]
MNTIIALVPMRHQSQRVPEKNYRPIAGRPLYQYILTTLRSVPEISRIVVDTDSPVIAEGVQRVFPEIMVLERPKHLRGNDVPMNEILAYDTTQVEGDFYLQTHSTNPLLRSETITLAIKTFLNHFPSYDSLFSVTKTQTRLWDQLGRAINHNPSILLQTQDLPPVYEENSCIYIFTQETLRSRRNRLGERPLMFEIDSQEAWDIDEELDFSIVDFLLKRRKDS